MAITYKWSSLRKRRFTILLHIFLLLALSAYGFTKTGPSPMPSPTVRPTPSGKVDVGGYSLYYDCSGQGNPTVSLESGGTGDSSDWLAVPGPRTFEEMTHDLQVLLEKAHVGGPYILVGWSMGGLLVRIFANQHPGEVAGVVLLDSAHPDMGLRLLACPPPELAGETENIQYLRQYFIGMSDSSELSSFQIDKNVDIQTGMRQARAVSTLGDLPLVVISQGPNISNLGEDWGLLPPETDTCLQQTWQDMQGEMAELSTINTRLSARGGLMFPIEEPELVVNAIIELVAQLR